MSKRRILVVDDEQGFAQMLKLNLERVGIYDVRVETKSTAAVAAAADFQPHLILLDVLMPGHDGGDIARALRNHELLCRVPVVFLTAAVSASDNQGQSVMSGGYKFLPKPIANKHLVATIEDELASRRAVAETAT